MGDYATVKVPDILDGSFSSSQIVFDYVASAAAQPEQMRVMRSCGDQVLDQACLEAIRQLIRRNPGSAWAGAVKGGGGLTVSHCEISSRPGGVDFVQGNRVAADGAD